MLIFRKTGDLRAHLQKVSAQHHTVGFVPTMGALHAGHLSLISESRKNCDVTVCSIFVNPTQFNNVSDLEKYPRNIPADILLLQPAGCDILFLPEETDLYRNEKPLNINLGNLQSVLEGASRPGHFEGVCRVVKLLLDAVQPDMAFFGRKDFQQCMVIQSMVNQLGLPVQLKFSETLREPGGLAMSSRNERLGQADRQAAAVIYQALQHAGRNAGIRSPQELTIDCIHLIESAEGFKVDYFKICDAATLREISAWHETPDPVALTAVYVNDVRLIDNLSLKKS